MRGAQRRTAAPRNGVRRFGPILALVLAACPLAAGSVGFLADGSDRWPASMQKFLRGDADANGVLDFRDITAVLSAWISNSSQESAPPTSVHGVWVIGDANGDGLILPMDLDAAIAGLTTPAAGSVLAQGNMLASAHQADAAPVAIAHWNSVPHDAFSGQSTIGVVAFHISGIDHVKFMVNGRRVGETRRMTFNPVSGVREYVIELDGEALEPGWVTLDAVAVPEWGEPRTLEPLMLLNRTGRPESAGVYVTAPTGPGQNGQGDLPPDEQPDGTIDRPYTRIYDAARAAFQNGDDTVYLLPGDHRWAGRAGGEISLPLPQDVSWLTIAAAPGFGPDEVRIVGNTSGTGGLNTERIRFHRVGIVSTTLVANRTIEPAVWFDACLLTGSDREDNATQFAGITTWTGGIYATDSAVTDVRTATKHWKMIRGCHFERIGSDVFHNPNFVVNCTVHDVRKNSGSGAHPDLIQFNGAFDNVIIYGLHATEIYAQGVFSRGSDGIPDQNIAFVNVLIDARSHLSQWLQSADHVLMWNVSFKGRALNISNDPGRDPTVLRYWSVRDSVIDELRIDPAIRNEPTQVWLGNRINAQRDATVPVLPAEPVLSAE